MRAAILMLLSVAAVSAQSQFPTTGLHAPVVIRKVDPEYTPEARKAKIEGFVRLYVEVGTNGRPNHIRILEGLGYGLDIKAVDAVSRWRFRPGTKSGVPVAAPVTIEVRFRLDAEVPV